MSTKTPPEDLQPPYSHYETEILRRAWDRLNRDNEHFMLAIVGEEGIGKSLTSLKIAKMIDPDFDEDRVIFDVADLLRRLRDEEYEEGQAFVLDEAGVSLGRRTWQEKSQIKVNQALQLIRSHNLALIFTLPRLSELDSQSVARLQAFFELTRKVDGKFAEGKWKYIDPDRTDSNGQNYKKYPRLYRDGTKLRIQSLRFSPPEGDFVDAYHEDKKQHQKQVYDEALKELEGEEEEDTDDERTAKDIASEVLADGVGAYISEHGQTGRRYVDKDLLRAEFDLSHSKANAAKKMIERETEEIE